MLDNKRKYERFNLPLVVSFRPTYGATEYSMGLMKNFSFEGLAIETKKFSFIRYESLELNLKFPQSGTFASLLGNVAWKKQTDDRCMAGIKFKVTDKITQNKILEKISAIGDIPVNNMIFNRSIDDKNISELKIKSKPSRKRRKTSSKTKRTGFTKQYFHGGSECRVTFRMPAEAAPDAKYISIVGDFNDWNPVKTPMKRLKNGDFHVTLTLPSNREYRFRYIVDGNHWENDWSADRYDPNDFGTDDSVVIL
jgi:hypothetical protein